MSKLRIQLFIEHRCTELALSEKELLLRTGTLNISKAKRRLEELYKASFRSARGLLERLPAALALPKEVLDQVMKDTIQDIRAAMDARYRAEFKPHALMLTEENGRPKQITIAGMCNAGRFIRINFPEEMPVDDYVQYAFIELENRSNMVRSFFYPICGITINYTPDHAKKFDVTGQMVKEMTQSAQQGVISIRLR